MPLQESYPALVNQAEQLENSGQPVEAIAVYLRVVGRLGQLNDDMLKKRPDLYQLMVSATAAAVVLARRNDLPDLGLEIADALSKSKPTLAPSLTLMKASILGDAGRLDEAIQQLEQLARSEDVAPQLVNGAAREAIWQDRPEDALHILDVFGMEKAPTAESDSPDEPAPDLWYTRFQALAKLGRVEEAEAAWLKSKESAPQDLPPSEEIVRMFIHANDVKKALSYADMEAEPFSRGLLRGLVAERMGKRDWARDEWWRVIREKFDVEKLGLVDWIERALLLDDVEKAEAAIAAGIEKHSLSPRLVLYRAIVFAKKGDLDDALNMAKGVMEANRSARFNRTQFVLEDDRWLIEQTIADPAARQAMSDILFASPAEPVAA